MNLEEIKLHKKATALNKIRKLYHPDTKLNYTYYPGEGSSSEQRDDEVGVIISQLEKELNELKNRQNGG